MNFMLIPSLEHIALVNVAASLWNQHDVRTLVTEYANCYIFLKMAPLEIIDLSSHPTRRKEKWQKIEEKVIEKVPQLEISTILKEKLLGFIQAVGLQILNWLKYHKICMHDYYSDFCLPNQFFWTPQGILDKKKTAEVLVKDENIDNDTRYCFACFYCLENDVREIWDRGGLVSAPVYFVDLKDIGLDMHRDLKIFWWMYLHGKIALLGSTIRRRLNLNCSVYRYMFRSAADGANKTATEYFLKKIFPREKSLFKTAAYVAKRRCHIPLISGTDPPKEYYSEVFCFLLSQVKDEHQLQIFKKLPFNVLDCFLDWPWQSFFLNITCRLWNFLPGSSYHRLLMGVINKVFSCCTDYNYREIFRELWQQSPLSLKRYMLQDSICSLLNSLLEINDKVSLILVVQDATLSERNALIFSDIGRDLCQDRIHQPDLLKFFILLFISSKDEMIKFKQEYEDYAERLSIREHTQTEFLQILDDLICVYNKRNIDDSGSSPPKRLCAIHLNDTAHDTSNLKRRCF